MLTQRYSAEHEALRRAVRQLRTSACVTQTQLSSQLGVPQSFVSKYESGERDLSYTDVYLICEAIGCSVHTLHERFILELHESKS